MATLPAHTDFTGRTLRPEGEQEQYSSRTGDCEKATSDIWVVASSAGTQPACLRGHRQRHASVLVVCPNERAMKAIVDRLGRRGPLSTALAGSITPFLSQGRRERAMGSAEAKLDGSFPRLCGYGVCAMLCCAGFGWSGRPGGLRGRSTHVMVGSARDVLRRCVSRTLGHRRHCVLPDLRPAGNRRG